MAFATFFIKEKIEKMRIVICIGNLAEIYNIKMKQEDEYVYIDNCRLKLCNCEWSSSIKCKLCPWQMSTSDEVDKEWKNCSEKEIIRELTEKKQLPLCEKSTGINRYRY